MDQRQIKIQHPIVTCALVFSENQTEQIIVQVRREHFNPFSGWELKDVFIKSLPDQYRYCTLRRYENKTNEKGDFYLLHCSR